MSAWRDTLKIAASIGFCYLMGAATYLVAPIVLEHAHSNIASLKISEAPGGVTGSDLIANLLTLSALTISGCIAYICLPSDRIEVRIATYVRSSFDGLTTNEASFIDYCNSKQSRELTPACRIMRGLLSPKSGTGGWHYFTDSDLETSFGSKQWDKLRRFVDRHIDAIWMISFCVGLGGGMFLGIACLAMRYVGISTMYYSGFEVFTIVTLLCLNALTALQAARFALGGTSVEKDAKQKISTWIQEVEAHVTARQESKRDSNIADLVDAADRQTRIEPELPMPTPRSTARVIRNRGGQNGRKGP